MFLKNELLKIPTSIKKETTLIVLIGIISSVGFDVLSFFMQLGKNQIEAGRIGLGLLLIGLYYCTAFMDSAVNLIMDQLLDQQTEHLQTESNSRIVSKILMKVRGKVWRQNPKNNSREVMSTSVLLNTSKFYIGNLWNFKLRIPRSIFQLISITYLFIGFVVVSNLEIKHSTLFVLTIVVVSMFSIFFSIKRMKRQDLYRKKRKEYNENREVAINDILNIEPLSERHSEYMAQNCISAMQSFFQMRRSDNKAINLINLVESFVEASAVIFIIGMKVYEVGFQNVDLNSVMSIIALIAIYNQVMKRVTSILCIIEETKDIYSEIKTYEPDFGKILEAIKEEEEQESEQTGTIEKVIVPKFSVKYDTINQEEPFSLKNGQNLEFVPGDIVLFIGPTGSGKSTFMKMLTRNLEFEDFELFYKRKTNGVINSIMHQTDGRLGSNSVLSELTLGQEKLEVEEMAKLEYILSGLHLYEEISEKSTDVFEYLKIAKISYFSTGQKQRLAIARLLYNLDDSIQVIGFDEATNALNDAITLQTLNFIKEFCKDKILLIATHQVEIGETVANKKFEFAPLDNQNGYQVTIK